MIQDQEHSVVALEIAVCELGHIRQARKERTRRMIMRTIKEEEVDFWNFNDFTATQRQTAHFLEYVYTTKSIHISLGYRIWPDFEAAWRVT